MILITGSSGHIGNVLVRKLVEQGEEVILMTKSGEKPLWLNHLDVAVRKANLNDPEAVDEAIKGSSVVFHLAGIISISSFDSTELHEINVEGTQYVVDACIRHGVKRLIYTSSVHALPERDYGEVISERAEFNASKLFGAYARTKAEATRRVLEGVKKGLDAVICFPSGVMGPHDHRGSEAGRLIKDYANNRLPVYINGAYNFVDVRDVVNGLLLAWNHGKKGEGYILSGEKMSLQEFFDILKSLHPQMRKPQWRIPLPVALASAWFVESVCRIISVKPIFTVYAIKVLQSNCNMPSKKASLELGYSARPVRQSIADSLEWFKENKLIS
ncbi:MAG: SDR family oxidoreductase [Saprospiraceae bacterium]|nr:SDR family oxidoreductase [Saprospiraceae bacterium]